jgi:hypothetical protein
VHAPATVGARSAATFSQARRLSPFKLWPVKLASVRLQTPHRMRGICEVQMTNTRECAVVMAMMLGLPSLLSAELRIAPPARPAELARTASALVIGRFVSQEPGMFTVDSSHILPGVESRPSPAVALTFTVENVLKADANAPFHDRATLALQSPPTHMTILAGNCPDCAIHEVTFEQGHQYLLFIAWNHPFDVYSLHYSIGGAFRHDRDAAVPLDKGTDLVRNVKSMSKGALLNDVRAGIQRP